MPGTAMWNLLDRLLFTPPVGRDGQARFLQETVLEAGPAEPTPPPPPAGATVTLSRRRRPGMEPERILLESLAAKTLHAWLQNRHQTLFPLTLNLRVLDPGKRALLMRMVAAAALAEGREPDEAERERIFQDLAAAGAGEEERRLFVAALASPEPLPPLLRQVQEAQLGPYAYAASLAALDRRGLAIRAWLDYLAARFALPVGVTAWRERRIAWRR